MGSKPEQERDMTADECDELADALVEAAAALPAGSKQHGISSLAQSYRGLAKMKRLVVRKVN